MKIMRVGTTTIWIHVFCILWEVSAERKKYQFKASLPYNKSVPQCYVPWAQIHYWPSGHVGLVHWCRLIFVHVSVWSFTLLGSDMKMLTGRSVAVFKSSQDVHSALLDAAVPIRWRVSLETDCGRKRNLTFTSEHTKPLSKRGKARENQNISKCKSPGFNVESKLMDTLD